MTDYDANRNIKLLLDEADRLLEGSQTVTERRLLQAYRKALDEIQAKIAKVFAASDTPTMTEMRKFSRLTSIEKQIADRIKELTQISVNITHQSIKDAFLKSYNGTANALEIGTGLNLAFDRLPAESIRYAVSDNLWLDALKQHNGKLISDIRREFETVLRTNARQEVVSGLAEGKSYSQVAKAIKERFDVAATRAKTIAFTEMHKSHSKGRLEGIHRGSDAAERLGLVSTKVWKHNHVGVPRPEHLAADGQEADPKGYFHVGGEKLEAPGLGNEPGNNINCHCSAQFELQGLEDIAA